MGRETRQARRARERRDQSRNKGRSRNRRLNGPIIAGVAIIVAVALFGAVALASGLGGSHSSTPSEAPGKKIDGIPCETEMGAYHVHAHFQVLVSGKTYVAPAQTGFNFNHDCLYWLHTHAANGIVHVEGRYKFNATLGTFFDVWGQPLSTQRVWKFAVKPGESMQVWTNGKRFNGNPRDIELTAFKDITIEIGPPFVKPKPFNWKSVGL